MNPSAIPTGDQERLNSKRSRKVLSTLFRTAIATGLLVYLTLSGAIDWSAFLGLAANWSLTLIALFLLFMCMILMAQRLCVLLRAHNMRLSLSASIKLTLMGTFFNFCLPGSTGGDAIRIYYAVEGNHGRRAEIATLLLFDRVVGMFTLLILPLLVSPLFPDLFTSIKPLKTLVSVAAAISLVMLVTILLCFVKGIRESRFLTIAFERIPLGHYAERIFDTIYSYRHKQRALMAATTISLLSQLLNVGVILVLARATTMSGPVPEMIVLIPFGFVATSVPVTPGGLGVGEAAFDRLFAIAGLTGGAQLLLGWRLLSIAIGFTGLGFYLQGRKRLVHVSLLHSSTGGELSSPS